MTDSAGGHSIEKSFDKLCEWVDKKYNKDIDPGIHLHAQPGRSPDLNMLDLGAWHSLQARVLEIKREKDATDSMEQKLMDGCLKAWAEWSNEHAQVKLQRIWETLCHHMSQVIDSNGELIRVNHFRSKKKRHSSKIEKNEI